MQLVTAFALLCLVPLAFLTYFTINLADRAVVREVNARMRTTSAVTASLVEEQIGAVADLTASYASRPILIQSLGDGNPVNFQGEPITLQLAQLQASTPGLGGVFIADNTCRLTQVVPATPAIVGVDFSYRDWCRGVKELGGPYISEAYESAIVGNPLVVATAVAVRPSNNANSGQPLGYLGSVYTLNAITTFVKQVATVQGVRLTITDQKGTVLVGSKRPKPGQGLASALNDSRVTQALAGRSGVTRSSSSNGETLSAYAPVETLGWAVVAEIPASTALAGVASLRSTALTVAGLLGLVLLAGVTLLARTLRLRREAERNLMERDSHTRAIIDAATDAFVAMDARGIITAWNEQAHKVFGWTETEAVGRRLSDTIVPPEHRMAHERGLAHFMNTGEGPVLNQRIEITAQHRNGHEFPVELAIWPVRSQDTWSFNAFVHDITERKNNEADLAGARDDALDASRAKSEFLATMSHEIRTPMNGVIGLTGLLLDTELTETQRHHAEGVRASGEALLGIINDILDFSKIEAGKLDLETVDFDLTQAIEDVANLVAVSAQTKQLELVAYCEPEMPTALRGDVGRIRQILLNFATNAIKFTETGEVVLRASLAESPNPDRVHVRFEVEDTGQGIAPSVAERLFQPFAQADASTTRRYGGTGLGLVICRRLAEAMEGEVGVDSEPGKGSVFWLNLPLAHASEPILPPEVPALSLEGRHVLVVDDNQTNREVLAAQLKAWHITSDLASDATQALQSLRSVASGSRPYDLALIDMAMPDVNGLELARMIQSDPQLATVHTLLLSSISVEANVAAEAGFVARLTKPVRLSHLYEAMVKALTPTDRAGPSWTPQVASRAIGSQGRVLIVEDHAINQEVAKGMVAKLGYRCDVAGDGIEALQALEMRSYDAVLMDCHMPEMDGYQATAEIRRRESGKRRVPIIAMTANALAGDKEQCLAAGMDGYLSKPIKDHQLETALSFWVRGRPTPDGGDANHQQQPDHSAALDTNQFEGLRELAATTGDPGFLGKLVDQYLAQAALQLHDLRKVTLAGDTQAIGQLAHGLKGTSATMGAGEVATACAELENAAGQDSRTRAEKLQDVAAALDIATAALRAQVPGAA